MQKARLFLAAVGTVLLVGGPAAMAADSSGPASDAATQAAACAAAASSQSGISNTTTGSAGTSSSSSSSSNSSLSSLGIGSNTGSSTSALTASSSNTSGPSVTNCPNCPPDLATALTDVLANTPNTTTASGSPACDPSLDAFCISTSDPNEGNGNPLTSITKLLPSQGIIAIGTKDPVTQQGMTASGIPIYPFYIFYDGNPDDMSPLGGYIGINGFDVDNALLGLVASTDPNDNFNRLGGNVPLIGNIIASLQKPQEAPDGTPMLLPGLESQGTGSSPVCDANDTLCISTHDAHAGTGTPLAPITSILPPQGIIAAGPSNPDTGQVLFFTPNGLDFSALYIFYDGEPYDLDPLGGYVGLNGHDFDKALLGLVASLKNTDNFNRAGGNLPIIGYLTEPLTTYVSPLLVRVATP